MTQVISGRFQPHQVERLRKFARRYRQTPSQMVVYLTEEALQEAEFPMIDFRDTAIGRVPFLRGTGLAIWEIISAAKDFGLNAKKTAGYFERPAEWAEPAIEYYKAHPNRIDQLIEENDAITEEDVLADLAESKPIVTWA